MSETQCVETPMNRRWKVMKWKREIGEGRTEVHRTSDGLPPPLHCSYLRNGGLYFAPELKQGRLRFLRLFLVGGQLCRRY